MMDFLQVVLSNEDDEDNNDGSQKKEGNFGFEN